MQVTRNILMKDEAMCVRYRELGDKAVERLAFTEALVNYREVTFYYLL